MLHGEQSRRPISVTRQSCINFTTKVLDPCYAQRKQALRKVEELEILSLASSSAQPPVSICTYQRWLVTSNVYALNKQYALNRHMCLITRLYSMWQHLKEAHLATTAGQNYASSMSASGKISESPQFKRSSRKQLQIPLEFKCQLPLAHTSMRWTTITDSACYFIAKGKHPFRMVNEPIFRKLLQVLEARHEPIHLSISPFTFSVVSISFTTNIFKSCFLPHSFLAGFPPSSFSTSFCSLIKVRS